MNIFFLDKDPHLAALYHADKHVSKMILESGQLLCTAINVVAGEQITPYKTTHVNHPCAVWVRESKQNALWVFELMFYLNAEYKHRYDKKVKHDHLTLTKLLDTKIVNLINTHLPDKPMTTPALAMPDDFKVGDTVESYRNYYKLGKTHLHRWTKRQTPFWIGE